MLQTWRGQNDNGLDGVRFLTANWVFNNNEMAKGVTVMRPDSWSNWRLHAGTARVWKGCRKLSLRPVGCHSFPTIASQGGETPHSRSPSRLSFDPDSWRSEWRFVGLEGESPARPKPQFKTCLPSRIDPAVLKMTVSVAADVTFMRGKKNQKKQSELICYSVGVKPEVPGFPASFASLSGGGREDECALQNLNW